MQRRVLAWAVAIVWLAGFSMGGAAQGSQQVYTDRPSAAPPSTWKTCPRCQAPQDRTAAWEREKVDSRVFNPHDLSGVWGWDGVAGAFRERDRPPLTEWGKQQYDAKGQSAPP